MMENMLAQVTIRANILEEEKYKYLFSVEEVNRLVQQGIPFREAYRQVGDSIERGEFIPPSAIHHTHEGSIGNLCNDQIREAMQSVIAGFPFARVHRALKSLLAG